MGRLTFALFRHLVHRLINLEPFLPFLLQCQGILEELLTDLVLEQPDDPHEFFTRQFKTLSRESKEIWRQRIQRVKKGQKVSERLPTLLSQTSMTNHQQYHPQSTSLPFLHLCNRSSHVFTYPSPHFLLLFASPLLDLLDKWHYVPTSTYIEL